MQAETIDQAEKSAAEQEDPASSNNFAIAMAGTDKMPKLSMYQSVDSPNPKL